MSALLTPLAVRADVPPLPVIVRPPTPTWAEFSAEMIALYEGTRKRNTVIKVRQVLKELAKCGVVNVGDVTPLLIGHWQRDMVCLTGPSKDEPRAPASIKGLLAAARPILAYASKRRWLDCNPFDVWTYPVKGTGKRRTRDRHYSREDLFRVQTLLDQELRDALADGARQGLRFGPTTDRASWHAHRVHALFYVAAFTGARKMEILKLRREDVRFDRPSIRIVDRAGKTIGGYRDRDGLKTDGSERTVGMPERLAVALGNWLAVNRSDWVFPNVPDTAPWTGGESGKKPLDRLKAAFDRAGVAKGCFQGLRQSWATHARTRWGFTDGLIQEQLGHSSPRTTREHYMMLDVDNLSEAVRWIDFGPPLSSEGTHA